MNYVLITPARDEAKYIQQTLNAVTAQTLLPLRWVIVSDNSSDGTDEIVRQYAQRFRWIQLSRRERQSGRHFASKVEAIRLGLSCVRHLPYTMIGFIDADRSFAPDYFAQVFTMFDGDRSLGLAGGLTYEKLGDKWLPKPTAVDWSVSGGVQLFRRECFECIGGYRPLPRGGIDTVAEVMARMAGWKVRTNPKLTVFHNRNTGLAQSGALRGRFREGWREFTVGYDALFEAARSIPRLAEPPFFIGSCCRLAGFFIAWLSRAHLTVPDSVVRFLRSEQRARLLSCLRRRRSPIPLRIANLDQPRR